jgi:hypothetical protein
MPFELRYTVDYIFDETGSPGAPAMTLRAKTGEARLFRRVTMGLRLTADDDDERLHALVSRHRPTATMSVLSTLLNASSRRPAARHPASTPCSKYVASI